MASESSGGVVGVEADAVVVGSGFGGGMIAHALVAAGKKVVMLERGQWVQRGPQAWDPRGSLDLTSVRAIVLDEAALEEGDLAQSVEALQIDDFSSAVIVLLSDGENTSFPEPLDIAQIAAEAGVRVYTVGIGSPQGALLELDGFSVMTQLNEATLQEIASLTNGSYYFATDEEELRDIYQNIDLQLTIRGESMEVTSILAGISLLFMLVSGALSLLWFGRVP